MEEDDPTYEWTDAWLLLATMKAIEGFEGQASYARIMEAGENIRKQDKLKDDDIENAFTRLIEGGYLIARDEHYVLTYQSVNSWKGAVYHQRTVQDQLHLLEEILGVREIDDPDPEFIFD